MATVDPVNHTLVSGVPTKIFDANITGTIQVFKNGLRGQVQIVGTDTDVAPVAPFEGIGLKHKERLNIGAGDGS